MFSCAVSNAKMSFDDRDVGSTDLFKNVRDLRKRLEATERSLISLHGLDTDSTRLVHVVFTSILLMSGCSFYD